MREKRGRGRGGEGEVEKREDKRREEWEKKILYLLLHPL